jgi:endoglucanase
MATIDRAAVPFLAGFSQWVRCTRPGQDSQQNSPKVRMNFNKLAALMSLLGALFTAPAWAAPPNYPFGARLEPYLYGIKPNHVTPAQMDDAIKTHYDAWKAVAIVNVPSLAGGKAIRFSPSYLTVSEGMAYGMGITMMMAGHDPDAQTTFDGLLKTVRARPAYNLPAPSNQYLMEWRLTPNGSSAGGGWSALDGDEGIAMALLMADRQWGSTGTWNYKQEALNTIAAMRAMNFKPDGTSKGLGNPDVSRTSDYMLA